MHLANKICIQNSRRPRTVEEHSGVAGRTAFAPPFLMAALHSSERAPTLVPTPVLYAVDAADSLRRWKCTLRLSEWAAAVIGKPRSPDNYTLHSPNTTPSGRRDARPYGWRSSSLQASAVRGRRPDARRRAQADTVDDANAPTRRSLRRCLGHPAADMRAKRAGRASRCFVIDSAHKNRDVSPVFLFSNDFGCYSQHEHQRRRRAAPPWVDDPDRHGCRPSSRHAAPRELGEPLMCRRVCARDVAAAATGSRHTRCLLTRARMSAARRPAR